MSKDIIGDACAFIPGKNGGKNRYMKMGVAMRDPNDGSLSFKLDTLPIPGCGWEGWVNVFSRDREARSTTTPSTGKPRPSFDDLDDDIPF